jgi:hypothetical protein
MGQVPALAAFVACTVALGGALMLTGAGLGHARHPRPLRVALRAQAVLPSRLQGGVVVVMPGVELLVGASVVAAVLFAPLRALGPLTAESVLYAAFAANLSVARHRRPAAPCGCFATDAPLSWAAVLRAGLLAGGTVVTAALGGHVAALPATVRLLCLAGGLVVAMLGWLLPELTRTAASTDSRGPTRAG